MTTCYFALNSTVNSISNHTISQCLFFVVFSYTRKYTNFLCAKIFPTDILWFWFGTDMLLFPYNNSFSFLTRIDSAQTARFIFTQYDAKRALSRGQRIVTGRNNNYTERSPTRFSKYLFNSEVFKNGPLVSKCDEKIAIANINFRVPRPFKKV